MPYPNDTNKIAYRPYIDGLRGVAVIAVVLYHAKLLSVTGGFVGVDVFFVISGFLITSIIVRDLSAGSFSLLAFWERRVRRIIPALFVVMLCSIIAAYFLLLYPPDYQHFGNTVIAQSVFTSNIFFMQSDNYFAQPSRYSPLLHTWSLSVEEQFYILYPFIILLSVWLSSRSRIIRRWKSLWPRTRFTYEWGGREIVLATVVIFGITSFFLNVWFVNGAPDSAFRIPFLTGKVFSDTTQASAGFYLLPGRAWELALGIMAALVAVRIRSSALAEVVAFAGIAAIAASVFLFKDGTPFPGVAALLPTLGAVAIIVANENYRTKTGALLSYSALVWVGLISYSLYLWHWPLFVFAQYASSVPLSKVSMAGLILVAIVVSGLSYRFIEKPFRRKTIFPTRNMAFLCGFAAMALLAILGFFIQRSASQFADRIPPAAKNILLASAESMWWGQECFEAPGDEKSRYSGVCRIGDRSTTLKRQFVVWGDSHANALVPLFDALGRGYGAEGTVFDEAFCVPIEGVHQTPAAAGCEEEKALTLRYIRENDIRHIILVARWSYYVMGGQGSVHAAFITDSNRASISSAEAEKVFERNLASMLRQLSSEGREIYIVEQVPEQFGFNVRDAFYRAVHSGQGVQFQGIPTEGHERYQARPNSVMERLAMIFGVYVIDPATILCKTDRLCDLESGGKLVYKDEDHLSTAGAMSLEPLFIPVFENMRSSGNQ